MKRRREIIKINLTVEAVPVEVPGTCEGCYFREFRNLCPELKFYGMLPDCEQRGREEKIYKLVKTGGKNDRY